MRVKIKKTELAKNLESRRKDLTFDLYQHYSHDAGYDVKACIDSVQIIRPFQRILIPTGLHFELESLDWEIQVRPRSGLAIKHGIMILNSPGTVDSGYKDELKVILFNASGQDFIVRPGDRVAQICFRQLPEISFEYVDKLNSEHDRKGGFGSSNE